MLQILKLGMELGKAAVKGAEKGFEKGLKGIEKGAGELKKIRPEKNVSQPFSGKMKAVDMPRAVRPERNISQPKNMLNELKTSYKERLDRTPLDGQRGTWTGSRGESKFVPNKSCDIAKPVCSKLSEYKMDGVKYKSCIPDFAKCAKETVNIDMTEFRYSNIKNGIVGNFEKADTKCAESWNKNKVDGRTNWTARDIEKFRNGNNYTWHECVDRKTCQLVPREIHDFFGHSGGVSECKKIANFGGGIFDV